MKTKLFVLTAPALLMFASAAYAQEPGIGLTGPVSNSVMFADHPERASMHDMGAEQSLLGGGGVTYGQGEQPLWEFGHPSEVKPLGDIAREFRQQKLTAKKAEIVFEKDGSTNNKAQ
jgi:hypothetical protein